MTDRSGDSPRSVLVAPWAVFAAVNLVVMYYVPGTETIPFHFVWISLALAYGLAPWTVRTMVVALVIVTATTATILVHHAHAGYIGWEETSEVPLMAAIFLVMVWHVRRRQLALAEMERLAAADRARAEAEQMFVRLMSHEMRTPITVARGFTELIRSAHSDHQTTEDTAVVLDELSKLDRGTQRLVTLITVEHGGALEDVDVDELLDRVVRRWSPAAPRSWQVRRGAGLVLTDGERLETVLDCLLENAVTYTADGDLIEVSGFQDVGTVVVEVTDSGEGIAAGDLPRVFDSFHRGENSAGRPGTGLGLAIVRRGVKSWGGTVTVRSVLGRGATFTLTLPVMPRSAVPPQLAPADPRTPGRGRTIRGGDVRSA